MARRRVQIIVNVHYDESGYQFYRIEEPVTGEAPAVGNLTSGFFINSDDVDEWLYEHAARVIVFKDYRVKED